jgi:hypothetical protein
MRTWLHVGGNKVQEESSNPVLQAHSCRHIGVSELSLFTCDGGLIRGFYNDKRLILCV